MNSQGSSVQKESIVKTYFVSSLSNHYPDFEEFLNEESEIFFKCVERISKAFFLSKEDRYAIRSAGLILISATLSSPDSTRETALTYVDMLFPESSDQATVREKILACFGGYFTPEMNSPNPVLSEIFHDAMMSLYAQKNPRDHLIMRHSLESKETKARITHLEWLENELQRLKTMRFKTFAGQVHFSRKLSDSISELQEIKASLSGVVTAEAVEKKILVLYRSASRNLIDMIAIADRKAGLLLSANAISLSLVISFVGRATSDHSRLWFSTILIAGTCALTVLFASLAARPIRQNTTKVRLEELLSSKEGVLYFGNAARLNRAEYIRGFQMLMQDDEMLERGLLEELHFYSCRIVNKLKMVRRAYVTMFIGILLSFGAFMLSEYL